MRIVRVYAGPDGESHFEDRDLSLDEVAFGRASREVAVSSVIFRQTYPGGTLDFHNPQRRQLIVFLKGEADIEASDGRHRRLGPGDLLLADDTTGRGHRLCEDEGRLLAFIPLAEDVDVDSLSTLMN